MMKNYGRDVSEADIQKAQFLNYLRAPKQAQQAMQGLDPMSSGYNKIQNAVASARADLSAPSSVVQVGTDGTRRTFDRTNTNPTDAQLWGATVSNLSPVMQRVLSPEGEAERKAARAQNSQARIDSQTPLYRGMAGVGLGNVNGEATLYPVAGHVGEYSANMGAFGLNGQGGTSVAKFEGARAGLVKQQERGRAGERRYKERQQQIANSQAQLLAGIKSSGTGRGKSGDTVGEAGQKRSQATYWADRSTYIDNQRKAKDTMARLQVLLKNPNVDPTLDKIKVGNIDMTLAEAQASAEQALADPGPQMQDYDFGAAPGAPATAGGQKGKPWFSGGGAPAQAPANPGAPMAKPDTSGLHASVARDLDRFDLGNIDQAIAYAQDPQHQRPAAEVQYLLWRKSQLQSRQVAQR